MPFPPNKTITELGIGTSRKFEALDDGGQFFRKGDILELDKDDNTPFPYFKRIQDRIVRGCHIQRLDYYDEPKYGSQVYVGDYPPISTCITTTLTSTNNSPMNIVSLFRKLTLSKEDKLMTELGLENPAGTPTNEGLAVLQELLYAERRADIIEKAKLIKAEMEEEK